MSFKGNQNNLQSPGNNLFNMFLNKDDENYIAPNVSLSSWAGSPEVIEECKEVISYLDKKKIYCIFSHLQCTRQKREQAVKIY